MRNLTHDQCELICDYHDADSMTNVLSKWPCCFRHSVLTILLSCPVKTGGQHAQPDEGRSPTSRTPVYLLFYFVSWTFGSWAIL